VVDFGVRGILRVRTHDASAADLLAVARDIGRPQTIGDDSPQVVVRFVDEISSSPLHLVDGGTMGYGEGGVYFLEPPSPRPLALVSQGERWGEALIVCRKGLGRIPLLSAAVDLAALSRGWAPLHGSAWITREGTSVLVAGWAHSGKTGALLAACERGAKPVGDDRILLSRDGSRVIGLGRPIVVKDWHLAQLRLSALGARRVRRALAKATPVLDGLADRLASRRSDRGRGVIRSAAKVIGRLRGKLSVELDASATDEAGPDVLVILETHRQSTVTSEPVDPRTVASSIAAQIEAELLPTLRAQLAFKYAFGGRGWSDVGRAPEMAEGILKDATRGLPTYLVRHPYPCSLEELDRVIADLAASAAPGEERE
jgi:hypothetical protein